MERAALENRYVNRDWRNTIITAEHKGMERGREKGLKEGRKEAQFEMAMKMKSDGVPVEVR